MLSLLISEFMVSNDFDITDNGDDRVYRREKIPKKRILRVSGVDENVTVYQHRRIHLG